MPLLLLVEADRGFDVSFPGLRLLASIDKVLWCYKMLLCSEKIKFWWRLPLSRWSGVAVCSWCCTRKLLALVEWIRNQKTSLWKPCHSFLNSLCEGGSWLLVLISIKRKMMPISASNLHLRPKCYWLWKMLGRKKTWEEDESVDVLIQPARKGGRFDFCGEIHGE